MSPGQETAAALDALSKAVEKAKGYVLRADGPNTHEAYADRADLAEMIQESLRTYFSDAYDAVALFGIGHDKVDGGLAINIADLLKEFSDDRYDAAWEHQRELAEASRRERQEAA